MQTADVRIAPLPRNLLDAMGEAGVDPRALARRIGIDPHALESGLNAMELDRFCCAGWVSLDEPDFGLRAGCLLRPERFGIVGIAAMSSPTLGVAIERIGRYNRLVWGDLLELRLTAETATVRLVLCAPPRPYTQARIGMELASLVMFARRFTGAPIVPLALTLRQRTPTYRHRYTEVFGCPVSFDQPDDSLLFQRADLDRPLISANVEMGQALVGFAEAALMRSADDGFLARVAAAMRRQLRGMQPTVGSVARDLCVGERTLQRRLAEHGTGFHEVLDGARSALAQEQLTNPRANVDEVTFLLGFATRSSFFRAFKRWTGLTPQRFRQQASRTSLAPNQL